MKNTDFKYQVLFTEASDNVGGQELQAIEQLVALQNRGFECRLACRSGGMVESTAHARGVATLAVPFRNSCHLPSLILLRNYLRTYRPTFAVCHSGHDANNLALAARISGHRPFLLRSKTYIAGVPKAVPYNHLADATALPSAYLRDAMLRNPKIRKDRLHVLYPGIDFSRIDSCDPATVPPVLDERVQAGASPVVLHIAMLRGEKGHLFMLDVVKYLVSEWPSLLYVIVGDGNRRQEIESRVSELGLNQNVLLAGKVVPPYALLRYADLVVMPSTYEPLGMAQIEALAQGVPVVASNTGGIPETVRDGITGLLAPPGDVTAWVSAVGTALRNPHQMREMAKAGACDVRSRFSMESNIDRLLAIAMPRQGG